MSMAPDADVTYLSEGGRRTVALLLHYSLKVSRILPVKYSCAPFDRLRWYENRHLVSRLARGGKPSHQDPSISA